MIKEKSIFAFLGEVSPLNILLVDDDMASQYVITKNLGQLNRNLDMCDSAHDAIRHTQRKNYDLIIVDLNMPVINGFELTKTLKITSQCNGSNPKVIGTTVMDHPLLPTLVMYSEVDDYIIKSADYGDLKEKIVNLCYLHQN